EYAATYTANTAATGLKAELKLSGWTGPKQSDTYDIVAAGASESKSGITRDQATYTAGEPMTVKVTLKDAHDNPVTGQAGALDATAVTVGGTSNKPEVSWAETVPGEYAATYTANTAATGLKAELKLSGWTGPKQSDTYDIVADNKITGLIADGHEFGPDEGFPTTGFSGATFTIKLEKDNPGNYTWTASQDWVTVSDKGEVTLKQGKPGQVKITGKRRNGGGTALEYTFTLDTWFTPVSTDDSVRFDEVCTRAGHGGDADADFVFTNYQGRKVGGLPEEWGQVTSFVGVAGDFHAKTDEREARIAKALLTGTAGGPVWSLSYLEYRAIGIRRNTFGHNAPGLSRIEYESFVLCADR
ncbi:hypothetical protein ACLEVL_22755, partial [Enterobacter ludwigii]